MTDETIVQEPTAQATPPAEAQNTDTAVQMIPKNRFDEINEQLKALKAEREKQAKEQEDAERQRLEETAQFKELYQQTLSKHDQTTAELEQLRTANEQATAALEALWTSKKSIVPKYALEIAEKLPLTDRLSWLAANESEFTKPAQGTPKHSNPSGNGTSNLDISKLPKVKF